MKADEKIVTSGESPVDVLPARVASGRRGELVWRPLTEAWLANKVAQNFELHVKGGYAWNASRYLPVFVRGEDGDAFLSFRRGR